MIALLNDRLVHQNLQLFLVSISDVQDVNDNPPIFEQTEYAVKVVESTPINSQVIYANNVSEK